LTLIVETSSTTTPSFASILASVVVERKQLSERALDQRDERFALEQDAPPDSQDRAVEEAALDQRVHGAPRRSQKLRSFVDREIGPQCDQLARRFIVVHEHLDDALTSSVHPANARVP
jgi:hypothetical protein